MTSFDPPPVVPELAPQRRAPGGGTTGVAGTLAFLGGLFALYLLGRGLLAVTDGDTDPFSVALLVVGSVELVALLGGGLALLKWWGPARWLVLAGCVVHTAAALTWLYAFAVPSVGIAYPAGPELMMGLLLASPAIATGVLVLVPATPAYLAWKRARGDA